MVLWWGEKNGNTNKWASYREQQLKKTVLKRVQEILPVALEVIVGSKFVFCHNSHRGSNSIRKQQQQNYICVDSPVPPATHPPRRTPGSGPGWGAGAPEAAAEDASCFKHTHSHRCRLDCEVEVGKKTQRENTLVKGKEEEEEEEKVKEEKLSRILQARIRRTDVLPSIFVVFDVTQKKKTGGNFETWP